ncbi:MAG: hypothetical protein FWH43_03300 [Endomicrobia bacterium]|nr:hypothetical protein [Endomicrobiia bacterium]
MKRVLALFAAVVFMSSAAFAGKTKDACRTEMQKCACVSAEKCKCQPDMKCKCDECTCASAEKCKLHGHGMMMKKSKPGYNSFAKKFKKFQEELCLTEEQAKEVEKLNAVHKEKQMPIKDKIKQLEGDKKAAFGNNDYETAKVKIREIAALGGDLEANSLDYKKAVMEILTVEQKDKFKELAAKAKEEMTDKKEIKDKKDKKDKKKKK